MIKKCYLNLITFAILLVLVALPLFFVNTAKADVTLEDNNTLAVSDNFYSINFRGYDSSTNSLSPTERTATLKVDENQTITYYCYNWSEISRLYIVIQKSTYASQYNIIDTELRVSYLQTDDLEQNIHDETQDKYLDVPYSLGNSDNLSLRFYINETSDLSTNEYCGYGFGLYKFEFTYTYFSNDSSEISTRALSDPIYIAILPDDIDTKSGSFSINYTTVPSSGTILDAFNFTLSTNTYDYVNPVYVEWFVDGIDENNFRYVLTRSDTELEGYYSFLPLYESYENRNGTTFYFDSNGIEATFTVTCTVYNTNGEVIASASTTVSTIKVPTTSYVWLIILLSVLILVIIASIILIIVIKRTEKIY